MYINIFEIVFVVCKYFVVELQNRLDETGKSKEVLRLGHGLSTKNIKAIAYKTS